MIQKSSGFLNLPAWHEKLQKILLDHGQTELLRLPVLGSENIEKPWSGLDPDDFFAAIETGICFSTARPLKRFTERVVTSDTGLAVKRIIQGKINETGFSAAIGSLYAFNSIVRGCSTCPRPEKIFVQNDAVTGYILSRIEKSHKTLQEASHEAQWENIASESPNLNLHGIVTRDRLILQMASIFGSVATPETIPVTGVSTICADDVKIASDMKLSIRLLGVAESGENSLKAMVEPCLMPSGYLLAQARGGSEMIYLKTTDGQSHVYSCPGTSHESQVRAIIHDLFETQLNTFAPVKVFNVVDEFSDCFYLRFSLVNLSDTLARILNELGRCSIEVAEIFQPEGFVSRETPECGRQTLVIVTEKTTRKLIEKAIVQLKEQVKLASVVSCFRYIKGA